MAFQFRYYIVTLGFLPFILNQTSDTQMFYCADWNCEEFISKGKTLLNYMGKTDRHLSFRQNEDIKILGKPVDINGPDWIGTVRTKVGLVPKSMVREDQVGRRSSTFKYPLNELPIWPNPENEDLLGSVGLDGLEQDVEPKEEETANVNGSSSIDINSEVNETIVETTTTPTLVEEKTPQSNETEVLVDTKDTSLPPAKEDEEESGYVSDSSSIGINSDANEVIVETTTTPSSIEVEAPQSNGTEVLIDTKDTSLPLAKEQEADSAKVSDSSSIGINSDANEVIVETTTTPSSIEVETPQSNVTEVLVDTTDTSLPPAKEDEESTNISDSIDINSPVIESTAKTTTITTPSPMEQETQQSDETELLAGDTSSTSPSEEEEESGNVSVSPSIDINSDFNEATIEASTTPSPVEEETPQVEHTELLVEDTSAESDSIDINSLTTESTAQITATPSPVEEETPQSDDINLLIGDVSSSPASKDEEESVSINSSSSIDINSDFNEATIEASTTPSPVEEKPPQSNETSSPIDSKVLPTDKKGWGENLDDGGHLSSEQNPTYSEDHHHDHDHGDHDHQHSHSDQGINKDTSSFIVIAKHLSSTLLSFLPEHLQDTILDVDDALVFTGIIALTLVSICVPYFLIEGFFSVRPLKKKVVELNKSLWKVSTAYENQQEEFEDYKKKALAYDEDKKRVEQLEYELVLLKKLEEKQKEQVVKYQKELKNHKELTGDMQSFLDKEVEKKKKIMEEKEKLKTTVTSLKDALRRTVDDLTDSQAQSSSAVMELELERQTNETLTMKCDMLEKEVGELKSKLLLEVDRRRAVDNERNELEKSKSLLGDELVSLKQICQQYEDAVSALNTEISNKENELFALQETLGEDSPLLDIAELKGKLVGAEESISALKHRLDSTTLENASLSRNLREANESLSSVQKEKDETTNRLVVLEAWFKEKEEDLRKAVEQYEAEKKLRGKGKDELLQMLDASAEENQVLKNQLEEFKIEFEETKLQHRNEVRAQETKSHEHWLSLCQAERKAQDARKESEMLRQKLTAVTREKEGEGVNGDGSTAIYPLITPDMVPIPLPDDIIPSYFGLGDGFMPPPPLPLDDDDREVHRPAPLGRVSPTYSDLEDQISPIRGGRGDYSDDGQSSGSDSPRRRSPRGWTSRRDRQREIADERHHRRSVGGGGPANTSSPIQGFNL
ncbi:transport and Golgi organization protein 1 [Folsomia candida]|uniref:Transport and Golgi organization protein 1 n=1 Tax=Folsomia candida TaxID=158441 RepID=A0A226EVX0_FOLCA|nr:transport and Golgi organization protein 1 [Folsomia candida]OXA61669.1 Transport and Golgi organization protein 1 [Folsomia candida]